MGGVVGRIFNEFGMVVAIAIVASAIVSLTVTPMLGSRLSGGEGHVPWPVRLFNAGFDGAALKPQVLEGAAAPAAARFLSFKRLLSARGLGLVSLASQRLTVDADTPSR